MDHFQSSLKLLSSPRSPTIMQRQIHVVRLFLQETGRYGSQYSRPYQTVGSSEVLENLTNRINEVSRGDSSMRIGGGLIAGLSGGLVVPSANWERELTIPNGWSEQRLRFMLEVHVESALSTEIYYFQGYTEFVGISMTGVIDPDMVFYINSFLRVNRARDYSGLSSAGYRDIIAETAQVIDGRFHSSNTGMVYGLRPEDLFVGVQSAYLSDSLRGLNEGNVVDTRLNHASDVFRSKRNNAIPSNFLGSVIENYRTAMSLADFGQGTEDIYSRAIQTSHEASPYENPFIRAISERKGMQNVTFFTMNDLAYLDPNAPSNTTFSPVTEAVSLAQPGDTDGWGSALLETQLATIVSNAVSGLMVENMFISIAFHTTNMTINGAPYTEIIHGQGVTTADMRQYYGNFITRFETEVMPDITMNNTIPVDIIVSADLYGDTHIDLSLEGKPPVPYITPSFADALMTPVVTTVANEYHGLVTGIEDIVNRCREPASFDNLRNVIDTNI